MASLDPVTLLWRNWPGFACRPVPEQTAKSYSDPGGGRICASISPSCSTGVPRPAGGTGSTTGLRPHRHPTAKRCAGDPFFRRAAGDRYRRGAGAGYFIRPTALPCRKSPLPSSGGSTAITGDPPLLWNASFHPHRQPRNNRLRRWSRRRWPSGFLTCGSFDLFPSVDTVLTSAGGRSVPPAGKGKPVAPNGLLPSPSFLRRKCNFRAVATSKKRKGIGVPLHRPAAL